MSEVDGRRSTFDSSDLQTHRSPMSDGLKPTSPAEAVELYIESRESELSEKTLRNQRYRLDQFLEFCENKEIEDMNALTGRDLTRFRVGRSQEIKTITLHGELQTLRVFLEFGAAIGAVEPGLRERVRIPDVEPEDQARDKVLGPDRAKDILDHLNRFAYASRDHVLMAILWHTGIRLGSLRAFDVGDFDPDEMSLELRHRPDKETPLKNKKAAERFIAVGSHYCDVIQDYIDHNRREVTDDYGRKPLISSSQGRLSDGAIRETVYQLTQPCEIGDCPHDESPESCTARRHGKGAGCPSSRPPHDIRRGSLTNHLREGTPQEVVSERSNVSKGVLDQHYDERSEREKMHIRRENIEGI